jgi:SpoVK/Ycf46/Vps4 family AAA+-type ATPase
MLRAGRFDRLIFVPPPNEEDRANIFKLNLSKAPLEKDIDYKALAGMSQGYTGADIANVCRQVKMEVLERSLSEKKTDRISQADLVSRISSTKPSAPAQSLARYTSFILKYGSR